MSVAIGFAIAFALALLAHRRRWLTAPIVGVTGILYTIPSVAVFFLLLPHHRPRQHDAIIALVAYTLLILFRNITTGLATCPPRRVDAARGMGLTDRQMLWRVELPLALPEILAGLRIARRRRSALATLAFFAGAGGLGEQIFADIDVQVQRRRGRRAVRAARGRARPASSSASSASLTPWRAGGGR